MMRIAGGLLLALSLSACVAGEAVMQETTRSLARTAVDGAVRQYLPGVNVSPYTDCVINNATTSELLQLASAASQAGGNGAGAAQQAIPVVRTIAGRGETQQCLISSVQGAGLLGGGLL